jgi:hypothetical protein
MKTSLARILIAAAIVAMASVPAHAQGRAGFAFASRGGAISSGAGHSFYGGGGYSYGYRPSFAFGGTGYYGGARYYGGGYGNRAYVYYTGYPYYYETYPAYPSYYYDDGGYDAGPNYSSPDFDGDSGAIAQVQSALTKLGYYHGQPTGILGAHTSAAISQYQQDKGLPVTGTVTSAVLHSLNLD